MAPSKRKHGDSNGSSTGQSIEATKRHKHSKSTGQKKDDHAAKDDSESIKPLAVSTLKAPKKEGQAFPRGGASALTPIEYKEAVNEAARDVLFETGPDAETEGDASNKRKKRTKPDHKGRSKDKTKNKDKDGEEEETIKIEGLSYKRLGPGQIVLGTVTQINRTDIAIAIPNNLTGFVPITSISDTFTEKLEQLANAEESEEGSSSEDENTTDKADPTESVTVDASKMVKVGQWLRAYVTESTSASDIKQGSKSKKHIELSLLPRLANSGLATTDLVKGNTVQASVKSVEDQGLIMDLGLEGVTGFMGSKEIGISKSDVVEGQVFLCLVLGSASDGKVIKLSSNFSKGAGKNLNSAQSISEAPTVTAFLPGTLAEWLITEVRENGLVGKIMGMLDVTVELLHSGVLDTAELSKKYNIGKKIKGRVIATFPSSDPRKVALSLLPHNVNLEMLTVKAGETPLDVLPIAKIIDDATVTKVHLSTGLFLDVGVKGVPAFVHISRVDDKKIENLSESTGPYKVGSKHKARITGYNAFEGMYQASMEQKILDQAFLRPEDVPVGEVLRGVIKKILGNGLLITLSEGITGHVNESHLSDIKLSNPEKKFREGATVNCRVLANNQKGRKIRLTLKKSLVNSDAPILTTYKDAQPGMKCPGTIVRVISSGAIVRFYGNVKAFLPVSDMSEAYIKDPREHFRDGQVVNVTVVSVDAEKSEMKVSCKDPSSFGTDKQEAFDKLKVGDIVSGKIIEKSQDDLTLELEGSGLKGHIEMGHLADGSKEKSFSQFKRLRAGQTLSNLVVLNKHAQKKSITLSSKPSLVEAAKSDKLFQDITQLRTGDAAVGFIRNITSTGIFVEFASGLVGFLPKKALPQEVASNVDFGYSRLQTFKGFVSGVFADQGQFSLSLKPPAVEEPAKPEKPSTDNGLSSRPAVNPVDGVTKSSDEYTSGKVTKARIVSVKDTQLNVELAENIKGRIDVSQVFDSLDKIKNKKKPLQKQGFKAGDVLDVKIIGVHDFKNHKYLPITHRTAGKDVVYELTAKSSDVATPGLELLSMGDLTVGTILTAFVNNIAPEGLWVNISPSVRGLVHMLDASNDAGELNRVESSFPVGSALQCRVVKVDTRSNRLDLAAKDKTVPTWENVTPGVICPVRVTKITDSKVSVQLSDTISGTISLADMADDYSQSDPKKFTKGNIISACIIEVDKSNKRIRFSTRPSRVLNSSASVQDAEVSSVKDLKVGEIRRGFITNVADSGVYIHLGGSVSARVKISDLTDEFVKNWKTGFSVDQLVRGKIVSVDANTKQVSMSLKKSVIDGTAKPTLADFKKGQIVDAHVRKVTDYGVFVVIDGSNNVSGLCHKSELADNSTKAPSELYAEGDLVKAKILRIHRAKAKIDFGLKASYFRKLSAKELGQETEMDIDSSDNEEGGVSLARDGNGDVGMTTMELNGMDDEDRPANGLTDNGDGDEDGLPATGFSWNGDFMDKRSLSSDSESDSASDAESAKKRKKRRRTEIKEDRTNDLNTRDPQSSSDYERMLLAKPNSSHLWVSYMAYEVQQGKTDAARAVAERALKTINIREQEEKLNVWVAMLNLENSFGTEEAMDQVLQRAIQYNDAQTVYEKLCSIFIQSGKIEKADEALQRFVKKFSQSPKVWINYASFLMDQSRPDDARKLLPRAMQAIQDKKLHVDLTLKFAQLEYRSGNAEKGRTVFEKLVDAYPKRSDLWNVYVDNEIKTGDKEMVRRLFPRIFADKNKLSTKNARFFFKKWLAYEEKGGDKKEVEKVKAKAAEYVKAKMEKEKQAEVEDSGDDE